MYEIGLGSGERYRVYLQSLLVIWVNLAVFVRKEVLSIIEAMKYQNSMIIKIEFFFFYKNLDQINKRLSSN